MDVIVKKYGTTHALWFRASKSFLLLEEPAFDVFNMQQKKMERHEIVEFCRARYGHIEHNIEDFVDEVSGLLYHYNMPEAKQKLSKKALFDDSTACVTFVDSVVYKIGDKNIRINYGHKNLFHAIHPIQAHLAVQDSGAVDHTIDCFVEQDYLVCKYNGKLIEAFKTGDMEYFTGNVKQLQYSILYERGFSDWMTMLHASGITNGKEAILFSAAAGNGKTTVSALLKARGFGYLSDDFIAADYHGKAYPFPAAISVKEGSVEVLSEYYPEIKSIRQEETFVGKMVRYIPVSNLNEESMQGFPVKAFVFVKYTAVHNYLFEPVQKREALQLLLHETWVNPQEQYVRRFFDWVEQTAFYRLNYGATPEAVEAVKNLFA